MLIKVFCVVSMLSKLPPAVCLRGGGGNRLATVGVKIKFPVSFRSIELKRYTVLTKNSYKTNKHL